MPDGYVLNFLLPRKLAVRATPDAIARLEKGRINADASVEASREGIKKLAVELNANPITVVEEANDTGGLFRAVRADEIAEVIRKAGHQIEEENIIIETPIKSVGKHTIVLTSGGVETPVTITIAHPEKY